MCWGWCFSFPPSPKKPSSRLAVCSPVWLQPFLPILPPPPSSIYPFHESADGLCSCKSVNSREKTRNVQKFSKEKRSGNKALPSFLPQLQSLPIKLFLPSSSLLTFGWVSLSPSPFFHFCTEWSGRLLKLAKKIGQKRKWGVKRDLFTPLPSCYIRCAGFRSLSDFLDDDDGDWISFAESGEKESIEFVKYHVTAPLNVDTALNRNYVFWRTHIWCIKMLAGLHKQGEELFVSCQ